MELLIAIVSHMSWPATVIILAWMFRDSLRSMLDRIESAKSKFLKVSLRSHQLFEKLSRAEGIADAVELPQPPVSNRRPKSDAEKGLKEATGLIQKEPAAAMFTAWDVLTNLTSSVIEERTTKRLSGEIIPEAAKYFDQGVVRLMAAMLMIVEQQKANPSAGLDKEFAFRFIKLAGRAIKYVEGWGPTDNARSGNVSEVAVLPWTTGGAK